MSYTELIPFKDGQAQPGIEFRNAWGGAARIWDALFKAHVPKKNEFDTWVTSPSDGRLWDLAKREDLPMFERAVHAFTFDLFYIRKENFHKFANDLKAFMEKYPAGSSCDHLPAWAKYFEESTADAVGIYCSSVSSNPWTRQKICPHCGNPTDETEAVPLGEGHEVYDWLESLKPEPAMEQP